MVEQVEVFMENDANELKNLMNKWHKVHAEAEITRTHAYGIQIPLSIRGSLTGILHVVMIWYKERHPDMM